MSDQQLVLRFDAPPSSATALAEEAREDGLESARQRRGGTSIPPPANGHAEGGLSTETPAIPARCPVLGKPVCYRADCRHYQSGGCVHPQAVAPVTEGTLPASDA